MKNHKELFPPILSSCFLHGIKALGLGLRKVLYSFGLFLENTVEVVRGVFETPISRVREATLPT